MKYHGSSQSTTNEMLFETYHAYGPGGIVLRNTEEMVAMITRIVGAVYSKDTSRYESRDGIDILRSECMRGIATFGGQ
jgi:hypothetical protein